MADAPKRLRVMAEFGSSGIFSAVNADPENRVMVPLDDLRLPADLRARFEHWMGIYWDMANSPTSFDLGKTNDIGRQLAKALKAHVGSGTYVEYQPISITGARGRAEEIL